MGPDRTVRSPLEEAAALGVGVLAELVAGAREGITIVDAERRLVYANPAACEVLGPLEQLRGQAFTDGTERELVCSSTTIEIDGRPHGVAIFRDLTGPRSARELHDSVSQALFSMTMHARGAQLSMARAGLDEDGPLGRSLAELVELSRGALAEMRAHRS